MGTSYREQLGDNRPYWKVIVSLAFSLVGTILFVWIGLELLVYFMPFVIGWFIAYAPADNPKYVVGGNMDRVLQGASSAMYVVRDVFGAIYGQPDTSTETTSIAD